MEQRSYMVMISLKPEPIPLNVKVLLLGDSEIYHTLLALDPEFKKLFNSFSLDYYSYFLA